MKVVIELKTAQLEELFLIEEGAEEVGLVNKLIDDFSKKSEGHLGKISAALAASDHSALENVAHSLKSSAALLGANQLAALCAGLEEAGHHKRIVENAPALMSSIREIATDSINEMHRYVASRPKAA